jgi:2-polyprenyl-6-methoxyphenol hydroxylase-like FAD-dependent oxidoreductase
MDLLVVGAGPTGLTLALQARAHGATVRVVESRPDADRPSRALLMHPRTLECLRPLGLTDDLLDHGNTSPLARLHVGGREVALGFGAHAVEAVTCRPDGDDQLAPPGGPGERRQHRPELLLGLRKFGHRLSMAR